MKKALYISLASIGVVGGVVATATFLSLAKTSQIKPKVFSNLELSQPLNYSNLSNLDIDFKKLLLGTTTINNGNYVIYIGTQTNLTNVNFIYDNQSNNINSINDLKNNANLKIQGSLVRSIANVNANKENNVYESTPAFYSLIDVLSDDVFIAKQKYEDLVKAMRKSTIEAEKNWGNQAASEYSFDINKKYKDIDGNEVYFRTDKSAREMRDILNYVNQYLKDKSIIALDDTKTPGIVLFYTTNTIKDGPRVFSESRNYDSSKNETKETYPSGNLAYNSNLKEFGGILNTAIYSVYGKKN